MRHLSLLARLWRRVSSALLTVSALLAAASAWAGCDLKQMEIPVRIVDQRPIATLTLNGTEVPMLVDSGAFFSMLSESTATQLKLPLRNLPAGLRIEGYTGRIAAKMTRVEKVGCWLSSSATSNSSSAATSWAPASWACWAATSCRWRTPSTTWRTVRCG